MKLSSFANFALTVASAFVLFIASVTVSAPCVIFFHQPKLPKDMKARMAAMRGGN